MLRVFIQPSKFEILPIQYRQNPYIDHSYTPELQPILNQHRRLRNAFQYTPKHCAVLPKYTGHLPDVVFCANGGLSLPGFSDPVILLPNMKYPQRKAELPYLQTIFSDLGIHMIGYPGVEPFEGQAELKWFHGGKKAICGYGYRSTKKTFQELDTFFHQLYGKDAPELLVLKIASPNFYHLDIAMLEYDDSKCIVHKDAFSPASIRKIQHFLGKENVTILETNDLFCLNSVIDGPNLITHTLTDPTLQRKFEDITGLTVKQVDTIEFEKSGGSVRCMTLDIHV